MSEQIYNWKRFWYPRGSSINLFDHGGYLDDPDTKWGRAVNPNLVSFDEIAEIPCLILLGEPGMGKTKTMEMLKENLDPHIKEGGNETVWLDLRAFGSEYSLLRELFDHSAFKAWIYGHHRLHLFLDSLDEGLLRINTLAALLINEFSKYPVEQIRERLCLRIACRTADWPSILEAGLVQLWGNTGVASYELAPLRRKDVIEAAKSNQLDDEIFLEEIEQKEAIPLAIKPITLKLLLNLYMRYGGFPSTQTELYCKGCELLCEENNPHRRETKLIGKLSTKQRMAVASRIAAITIFSNRYAVWTDIDRGNVAPEDITIQDLCGGSEYFDNEEFKVTQDAVEETLRISGLFSSRGPKRLGWAHQSYAEFLAAWYIQQHQMNLSQIKSLIVHPAESDWKLIPQLHETAGWIASMNPKVFREIMTADPDVLLQSDVATADIKDREALVENLLKLYNEEKLLDTNWKKDPRIRYKRYPKLNHPGLTKQLRPYIVDKTKGFIVRRVAIDIAEACHLQALQNDLVDIVLDQSQPMPIRINVAYAIGRIGDDTAKEKLKPFVFGEGGDDPEDELKGCALRALWPDHLSAEELFSALTPLKNEFFCGAYYGFLASDFVQYLQPIDLPIALQWVEKQGRKVVMRHSFIKLIDDIILKAAEYLETPDIFQAFAKVALLRLEQYDEIVDDEEDRQALIKKLTTNDKKRRTILEAMVSELSDSERKAEILSYSKDPLVMDKDFYWFLEQLKSANSEKLQAIWTNLIRRTFYWNNPDQQEAIAEVCQGNPNLTDMFDWYFKPLQPVELNSPEAQKMKKEYLEMQQWQERLNKREQIRPQPLEEIPILLDQFEAGNFDAWLQLKWVMTFDPDNNQHGTGFEPDIPALPGWKAVDSPTRTRIINVAKTYIMEQSPPDLDLWIGEDSFHSSTFAGYSALRLTLQGDPEFAVTIPTYIWQRWAPIVLAFPTTHNDEKEHRMMIGIVYHKVPDEVIKTLLLLIDKENKKFDHIFIIEELEYCWDNRLSSALLTKVEDESLKPQCIGDLLSELLDHDVQKARTFAESLISFSSSSNEHERTKAIVAACALLLHSEDAGWSVVWPAIQQDTKFNHEVIKSVAHGIEREQVKVGKRLSENQLADLYIWLVRKYPYNEDPQPEGVHTREARESIAIWRNNLLRHLQHRGTPGACEAIRRIANELPELDQLKWTLLRAQNITLSRTWVPPRSKDILKLVNDQDLHLVRNGDELLDVLIESLKRLEKKLHDETPAVFDLWNEVKWSQVRHLSVSLLKYLKTKFKKFTPPTNLWNGIDWRKVRGSTYLPKDENSFSDYVKRHLERDVSKIGIFVKREPEIRRSTGPGQGKRTDIHVDAIVNDSNDSATAIIETKCCWHDKLDEAMETQLVNGYLKNNHCQHGLYLVGWFNCDQWDDADSRKQRAPKHSIAEAQKQFDEQAAKLSQNGLQVRAFVMNTALR